MRSPGRYMINDVIAEQSPKPFSMMICLGLVVYLPPLQMPPQYVYDYETRKN